MDNLENKEQIEQEISEEENQALAVAMQLPLCEAIERYIQIFKRIRFNFCISIFYSSYSLFNFNVFNFLEAFVL